MSGLLPLSGNHHLLVVTGGIAVKSQEIGAGLKATGIDLRHLIPDLFLLQHLAGSIVKGKLDSTP